MERRLYIRESPDDYSQLSTMLAAWNITDTDRSAECRQM